jgi:thymidylate synthase
MEHSLKISGKTFKNAEAAFLFFWGYIPTFGRPKGDTHFLDNVGFYILNPLDNLIQAPFRNWSHKYAEYEWQWYLSGNRSVSEIKKRAPLWDKMHAGDDIVNSNYGYQWTRNNQVQYVIDELKRDPLSRRAVISIYDGKEHEQYKYDTPCTLELIFNLNGDKLNMSVLMRSNDLWFGFCNDQYCFSKLQGLIADALEKGVGYYYHYAADLHLYNKNIK